jgi:stage V sporulation protein G
MKVTNVSVKLSPQSPDRLKAFCTMTLDGEFVVRDLKIIEGTNGLFVAMPSRKLTDHCPKCHSKNHLRAKYCNDCGAHLPEKRISDEEIQGKLHADIAHPINSECRGRVQEAILQAYREELRRAGRADEADRVVAQTEPEGGYAEGEGGAHRLAAGAPEKPPEDKGGSEHRFGEGLV